MFDIHAYLLNTECVTNREEITMTKHKHADMIKAWADNGDLIVFVKTCTEGAWTLAKEPVQWWDDSEYFASLPQHAEACLHWLNGSDVEEREYDEGWAVVDAQNIGWSKHHFFMDALSTFRIKPRKEKRWIAVHKHNAKAEVFYKENIIDSCLEEPMYRGYQKFEIEIEV